MSEPFSSDLSARMKVRLCEELAPGERLVWAGRARPPVVHDPLPGYALLLIFLIILGAITFGTRASAPFLFLALLAAIAFLVYTTGRRGVYREIGFYALTDRRAILWLPFGPPGSYEVRSFRPGEMTTLFRVEHADDSGDLIFLERPHPPGPWKGLAGDGGAVQLGFRHIRHVRKVEELLRQTLLEPRPGPHTDRGPGVEASPPANGIQTDLPPAPRWTADDPSNPA